jgi:hypothetical protein
MRIADQTNFAAGALYTVFGAAVAVGSLSYDIGSASRMGPGYFRLGAGIALAMTRLVVLIGALRRTDSASRLLLWPLKNIGLILASVAARLRRRSRPWDLRCIVPAGGDLRLGASRLFVADGGDIESPSVAARVGRIRVVARHPHSLASDVCNLIGNDMDLPNILWLGYSREKRISTLNGCNTKAHLKRCLTSAEGA